MKRPLAAFTVILCAGIFVAGLVRVPFLLVYILCVILVILSLLFIRKRLAFGIVLIFLAFFLGIARFKNAQILPQCHIVKYAFYHGKDSYVIKGFIDNEPRSDGKRTVFVFKAEAIQSENSSRNCCGRVLVYLKGKKGFCYGEELILKGNLRRPFGFKRQSGQSYRDYLKRQDIWFVMNVKNVADVISLNKNRGFLLQKFALLLKKNIEVIFFKHLSPVSASILDAMVLGERSGIPAAVNNSMIKSGTVHILVVSGFNVGIVSFALLLLLKLMRIPPNIRFSIAIASIIVYCLATGASTPVVRATVMAIIFMLAFSLRREPDIYNSLSISAIFILGTNPQQLFDIGFQLSFVSVISIVYFYPKMKIIFRLGNLKVKCIKSILEGCLVSFSAWLGTFGLIAYYFKIFSPITVLANLFIVPLASLITLCGFSLVMIGFIFPFAAKFFASSSELAVAVLININMFLIKLPYACLRLP